MLKEIFLEKIVFFNFNIFNFSLVSFVVINFEKILKGVRVWIKLLILKCVLNLGLSWFFLKILLKSVMSVCVMSVY